LTVNRFLLFCRAIKPLLITILFHRLCLTSYFCMSSFWQLDPNSQTLTHMQFVFSTVNMSCSPRIENKQLSIQSFLVYGEINLYINVFFIVYYSKIYLSCCCRHEAMNIYKAGHKQRHFDDAIVLMFPALTISGVSLTKRFWVFGVRLNFYFTHYHRNSFCYSCYRHSNQYCLHSKSSLNYCTLIGWIK